jgi:DNA-binding CsgD family transcriptional regulator
MGECVKGLDRTVQSQNDVCKSVCGDQVGRVCTKGCMKDHVDDSLGLGLNQGFRVIEHMETDGRIVDAVVINDGKTLTTLLYDRTATIEQQLECLKAFNLTPSETTVIHRILIGHPNREVAKQLSISPATLRVHLKRIYKKIPPPLVRDILERRRVRRGESAK